MSYDWSNAKAIWANTKPMVAPPPPPPPSSLPPPLTVTPAFQDCEALLLKQAELTKAINPHSKTWVSRNLVKALPWFGTVREKMDDPVRTLSFHSQRLDSAAEP